jgi:hypothetical protein
MKEIKSLVSQLQNKKSAMKETKTTKGASAMSKTESLASHSILGGGGGKNTLQVKDTISNSSNLSHTSGTSSLSCKSGKMKSILTIFSAFVLFVLFSFTFSSCKDCGKKETKPAIDRGGNANNMPSDAATSNTTTDANSKTPDGSNPVVPTDGDKKTPDSSNPVAPVDGDKKTPDGSNPVAPCPNKDPDEGVVNSYDVVDISKIEAAKQVVCEAARQAEQAAENAKQAANQIVGHIEHVTSKYAEYKVILAQQKDLGKVGEFAKTSHAQADQATQAARDVATMNAALSKNIDPSVKETIGNVVREADEADKQAQNAAINARQAVVDTADVIIKKWRAIADDVGNDSLEIMRASMEIVKVCGVKVELLVELSPFEDNKTQARVVLEMMRKDAQKVAEFADNEARRPGPATSSSKNAAKKHNDNAKEALRQAEETCK